MQARKTTISIRNNYLILCNAEFYYDGETPCTIRGLVKATGDEVSRFAVGDVVYAPYSLSYKISPEEYALKYFDVYGVEE